MRRILRTAEVVYGGLGTPLEEGAAVLQEAAGEWRITFLGDADEARQRFPDAEPEDAGAVLAPAPVNAHTHLDLSTIPRVQGNYIDFVRAVIDHGRAGGRGADAARRGLADVRATGAAAVGDVVADEATMFALLAEGDLRGVAYWEVIAPDPADADTVFDATVERLRRFRAAERPDGLRVGLSPHAPHTVSAPLLQRLGRLARANGLPLQMHVAESPDEARLHRHGDGPLREALGPLLGAWRPSGASPVGYLRELGVLEAGPTLVHAVHVDDADVRALQHAGCTVVHCPRSNAALGCGRFPWERYARHGVSVGFGTDSLGSSPSLDVEDEVVAAAAWHGERANPRALVRAAVKGGHRALGLEPPKVQRGADGDAIRPWRLRWPGAGRVE